MFIMFSPSRRTLKPAPHESPSRQPLKLYPHENSPSTTLNTHKILDYYRASKGAFLCIQKNKRILRVECEEISVNNQSFYDNELAETKIR